MKKSMKIIAIVLIALTLMSITTTIFAAGSMLTPSEIEGKITYENDASSGLTEMAGKVIGLIRNIAVIAGVILLTVIGVKFMLGSAEEKAEYKKSLVPLVVGIIVVMAATQIATMIFGFFK